MPLFYEGSCSVTSLFIISSTKVMSEHFKYSTDWGEYFNESLRDVNPTPSLEGGRCRLRFLFCTSVKKLRGIRPLV